jgi:hypothetical protein
VARGGRKGPAARSAGSSQGEDEVDEAPGGVGGREAACALGHRPEAGWLGQERPDLADEALGSELALRQEHGGAGVGQHARVRRLLVAPCPGQGDEDRRQTQGGKLGDGAGAGALSLATTASDSVRDDSSLERSEVVFSQPKVVGLLEPGACHLPRGKRWGSGRSRGGLTVPGVASW